jgi:ElaB/YqjD/DUF883 family membrane-anchored ribosome-binding protein
MSQIDQVSPSSPEIGAGVASDAQAKATEVAERAQEKAHQAAGQVQDRLREQLDQRSSQAATQITEQASDLRSVGKSLREEGKEGPAKAADQLARYAERVGGYLRDKDSHALLADAEDFGRRQPWAIAVGGIVLGFAASRFLKASSSQRYHGRTTVPRPNGVYSASTPSAGIGMGERSQPSSPGLGAGPVM